MRYFRILSLWLAAIACNVTGGGGLKAMADPPNLQMSKPSPSSPVIFLTDDGLTSVRLGTERKLATALRLADLDPQSAATVAENTAGTTSQPSGLVIIPRPLHEATALESLRRHGEAGRDLLIFGEMPDSEAGQLTAISTFTTITLCRPQSSGSLMDSGIAKKGIRLPDNLVFCGRRPRALRHGLDNLGRWIPWHTVKVNQAADEQVVAATWIDRRTTDVVSVWSHVGVDPLKMDSEDLATLLQPILRLHASDVLMLEGGSDRFHYAHGETPAIRALLLNRSPEPKTVRVVGLLTDEQGGPVGEVEQSIKLGPRERREIRSAFARPLQGSGDFHVRIELSLNEDPPFDVVEHRLSVAQAEQIPLPPVRVNGGKFQIEDRPWTPVGVHYWLPFVDRQEDPRLWHDWLDPALYDPDVAERELTELSRLGVNAIVAPLREPEGGDSLRDFLHRCRRHNLRCMVFLSHAHPLEFEPEQLDELLSAAALDQQPAVFAFDLAWEPHLGVRKERVKLDKDWTRWVSDQYGSIGQAESAWGFKVKRNGGLIAGPADQQITEDGDWRVMVAAYRRFIDDLISRNYGEVTRLLRRRCPVVLLGTRTGYGGTGTQWIDDRFPFDLISGADHLDYVSPEAYGLSGAWEGFLDGKLIDAWARLAGRNKPVVWMEYGCTGLRGGPMDVEIQRDYYDNMIRLMCETGAAGSFAWWTPGGYRANEKSDYGLFDELRSPRPALLTLGKAHDALTLQSPIHPPTTWITADRDLHPRGLSMLIVRHREEFLRRLNMGERVGLRLVEAGRTTRDAALTRVGHARTESGPYQFLNGEFVSFSLINGDDKRFEIDRDAELAIAEFQGVKASHGEWLNTGFVGWSGNELTPGDVSIELMHDGKRVDSWPLAEQVQPGGIGKFSGPLNAKIIPGSYSLRLASERTGPFGECLRFKLR